MRGPLNLKSLSYGNKDQDKNDLINESAERKKHPSNDSSVRWEKQKTFTVQDHERKANYF